MPEYIAKQLKLLDLKKCNSVADIVEGMTLCSFGARMLGEATAKISEWITQKKPPLAIYDGKLDSPLGRLLQEMSDRQWLAGIISQQDYAATSKRSENLIILGAYSESFEAALSNPSGETIFINAFGMAKSADIADGYFPNVVFSEPSFVVPVIFTVLEERLKGKPTTITQFISELLQYGGLAAEVSKGAHTLLAMVDDPDCTVVLTLSGAMTIAKMGLIICELVDQEMVHAICSTGALMAHGLVESIGLSHFKYNPKDDDINLAQQRINRVTDTLEPETNLDHIEQIISQVLDQYHDNAPLSPRLLHGAIGEYLAQEYPHERGILKSAYEQNVPVFVPAFYDSEIGNDIYTHNRGRELQGRDAIPFNLELDTKYLLDLVTRSEKVGIFTIGGGVPRNFMQNVAPLIELMNERQVADLPEKKFAYGCRICPDPMYYGHLSGCTYSEGMSWRKMEANGLFSEIRADATQILPFLVKFVMEAQERSQDKD